MGYGWDQFENLRIPSTGPRHSSVGSSTNPVSTQFFPPLIGNMDPDQLSSKETLLFGDKLLNQLFDPLDVRLVKGVASASFWN